MTDGQKETLDHIARVEGYLNGVANDLKDRAEVHDASKLLPPEAEGFERVAGQLRGLTYGSPEYRAALEDLGPILDHHYAHNSHHPEHYENGIDGMDLLDVVEMLCDWKAASERHANGDIMRSIEINEKRFNMSPQLASIFRNTVDRLGWVPTTPAGDENETR